MADHSFPPTMRLKTSDQFDRVFAGKCSAADANIVVYTARNDCPHPRLGLVVSRKVGNAVRRNRWKRLLREAFRLCREELPASVDIVVIPRQSAEPELAPLQKSLVKQTQRAARKLPPLEESE